MTVRHTHHELWCDTVFRSCARPPDPLKGMLCLDLDGTLIHGDTPMHPSDVAGLKTLARAGWLRIIATGRSLESFRRAIPDPAGLPVDYLVFSSGVGIIEIRSGSLIRTVNLSPTAVERILDVLNRFQMDYMIHHPAPDNVRFSWWSHSVENDDFHRRISLYTQHSTPLKTAPDSWTASSAQVISVVPPGDPRRALERIRNALPMFNVIRTTSPLDGYSTWIEIYPGIVSKARACQWVRDRLSSADSPLFPTVAAGNDFNDLDMLEWADRGYVMPGAPESLREQFPCLTRNNPDGNGGRLETLFRILNTTGSS